MVSSAVFSQENLLAHEFFAIQDSQEHVVILDVRICDKYEEDRIPGAIYAGEKEVLMQLIKNYDSTTSVLVYCEIGKRSKEVMKILKKEGFQELYNLKHGYRDWKSKEYPVDNEKLD